MDLLSASGITPTYRVVGPPAVGVTIVNWSSGALSVDQNTGLVSSLELVHTPGLLGELTDVLGLPSHAWASVSNIEGDMIYYAGIVFADQGLEIRYCANSDSAWHSKPMIDENLPLCRSVLFEAGAQGYERMKGHNLDEYAAWKGPQPFEEYCVPSEANGCD